MTSPILLFINDHPVRVAPDATVAAAVASFDAGLAEQLGEGAAYLTDGRGIAIEAATPVFAGAIVRVVVSARLRPSAPLPLGPSDDAHA